MKINFAILRHLTTKYLVAFSLGVSLLGMGIILIVGFTQIRKSDGGLNSLVEDSNGVSSPLADSAIEQESIQTTGGEGGTPIVTLKVSPEQVTSGQSATIEWFVESADTCEASGNWSGAKNLVGNQDTGALTQASSYILTCTNAIGASKAEVAVAVGTDEQVATTDIAAATPSATTPSSTTPAASPSPTPASPSPTPAAAPKVAPVLTMTISSGTITAGGSATISWSINSTATPAPTCTASGSWSGAKATSGSSAVTPAAGSYTYTLACSNTAGTSTKSVSLTVNAPAAACGSGGACTTANVAAHSSTSDCWTIINGNVYAITSTFVSSTHSSTLGGPTLGGTKLCGLNKTSTYNNKHSNGNRTGGGQTANWWLTGNGNSLVGPWSGN